MHYTLPIGSTALGFSLLGTDHKKYSLKDFHDAEVLVIFFTCNHCPYVIGSDEETKRIADKYKKKGVQFIAINSNSKNTYPEDSFPEMIKRMENYNFPWVYLHDENQEIAKKYGALKTPHFFVFDRERKLIYCGRAIDNPKDPSKAKTHELEDALEEYLSDKPISTPLTNPVGCNVKWEGKPAHWMPPEACDLV